jgi:DNA-binding NarL/FixJ family response regulator
LHGGTSGLEAARMLYECWGVRSIYLSANLDAATRAQADQWQPLGFIGKPFLPAELLAAVERAVELVPGEKNEGN